MLDKTRNIKYKDVLRKAHKMFFDGSERFGVPDLHYSFETGLKYSLLRT